MVQLSGLTVRDDEHIHGDIEIVEIGLRPGEKLYEELLIGDNPAATRHPRIMMASEPFMPLDTLRPPMKRLADLIDAGDAPAARALLRELVPEFAPTADLVDHVYMIQGGQDVPDAGLAPELNLAPVGD